MAASATSTTPTGHLYELFERAMALHVAACRHARRAHGRDDLALDWAERGRAAFPSGSARRPTSFRLVTEIRTGYKRRRNLAKRLDRAQL